MVWLIGINGMLGREVARQLREYDIDFIGTGSDVDITRKEALDKFVSGAGRKGIKFSFIINCAGYTDVNGAEEDREAALKVNAYGPGYIAQAACDMGAVMIHISTDYVFDGTAREAIKECCPLSPVNFYGKSKAMGDCAVQEILDRHYILRTSWLYGSGGRNFVYTMMGLMNTRGAVKVVNDQAGSPTFTGTPARVIARIIKGSCEGSVIPYGVYNCTDLGAVTWYDFAVEIRRQGLELGLITNRDCVISPCSTAEYGSAVKRPAYSVLCKDKLQEVLSCKLDSWECQLSRFLLREASLRCSQESL